jgi:hypothetical protein
MAASQRLTRPPASDSPWFWAYIFSTSALIALFLASFKFGHRQAQIERQFQARQPSGPAGEIAESESRFSSPGQTIVSLQPLVFIAAAIQLIAWGLFWWNRFRSASAGDISDGASGVPP